MGKHIAPLLGKHAERGTTSRNPNIYTHRGQRYRKGNEFAKL